MGLVARAQKNIAKLNNRIAELLVDPDIASEYRGLQEAALSKAEISDGLKEVLRLENDIENLQLVNNKPIFGNEITACLLYTSHLPIFRIRVMRLRVRTIRKLSDTCAAGKTSRS